MRPSIKYSLITVGIYFLFVPLHELSHLFVARLENLPVENYSLLSFNPSVVLSVQGTPEFFLSGPIIVMIIIGVTLIYFWKTPLRNYLLVLFATELVADLVDFQAALNLLLR